MSELNLNDLWMGAYFETRCGGVARLLRGRVLSHRYAQKTLAPNGIKYNEDWSNKSDGTWCENPHHLDAIRVLDEPEALRRIELLRVLYVRHGIFLSADVLVRQFSHRGYVHVIANGRDFSYDCRPADKPQPVAVELGCYDGDSCGLNGCKGILARVKSDGGCYCHIAPPCSYCVDAVFRCPECDRETDAPDAEATQPTSEGDRLTAFFFPDPKPFIRAAVPPPYHYREGGEVRCRVEVKEDV